MYIKCRQFNDLSYINEWMEFSLVDIKELLKSMNMDNLTLVSLDSLFVERHCRHRGIGTSELKTFCDMYKEAVINVTAGVSTMEYPEEPAGERFKEILEKVCNFYDKNNFVDVNHYIGQYENKRTYVYANKYGKRIINEVERLQNIFNSEGVS